MKKWKVLDSKIAFDNPYMKVRQDEVELPDGIVLDDFFVWIEGDVSMVVPVTEEGDIVLVRQYKHAAGDIMIEFPAGYIDKDEDPLVAAKRELGEETGFVGEGYELLSEFINLPTKVVGKLYVYLARNCKPIGKTNFDANENIQTLVKSLSEVEEMIARGEIRVSGTIAAFYLTRQKLGGV